jgi:adenosylhomocysteine nucleosidase|uniref:Nucleoside phosphorylase domain-containing protein n=1 Tax=Desulfobacca acetoxidans TaxID=60893 RepID=A0A7C5ALT4_9BACT
MSPASVKVALLAALLREVQPFLRRVRARPLNLKELSAWEFHLPGGSGLAALTGMGEPAAARTATRILASYHPRVLLSLGFGGALTPEIDPGALVLGDSFWYFAPERGKLEKLLAPGPPKPLTSMLRALKDARLPAFAGSLVTTPWILEKRSLPSALKRLSHPVLDLETAAVAAAAYSADLPFLALRAVTDAAENEIPDFLRQAARKSRDPRWQTALAWVRENPRRLMILVHFWQQSRRAARNLAQALEIILPLLM